MASTLSHESKQREDSYQNAIEEVERAQVVKGWTRTMMRYGVEARGQHCLSGQFENTGLTGSGILPVPPEHRTDSQYSKIFFVWFAINFNILSSVNSHPWR
jgi:hypothetical protein